MLHYPCMAKYLILSCRAKVEHKTTQQRQKKRRMLLYWFASCLIHHKLAFTLKLKTNRSFSFFSLFHVCASFFHPILFLTIQRWCITLPYSLFFFAAATSLACAARQGFCGISISLSSVSCLNISLINSSALVCLTVEKSRFSSILHSYKWAALSGLCTVIINKGNHCCAH